MRRFAALAADVATMLTRHRAILDGELVCLDAAGRTQFYDLMFRRGSPVYRVFDVLWIDGQDLRGRSLLERKRMLHRLVGRGPAQAGG